MSKNYKTLAQVKQKSSRQACPEEQSGIGGKDLQNLFIKDMDKIIRQKLVKSGYKKTRAKTCI